MDSNRPRENLTNLKGRIPGQVWDKLARARGAHLNAMEGLPVFAAAMVCQCLNYNFSDGKLLKSMTKFGFSSQEIWQNSPPVN
jgi:uncharacterized MAPEG superfamily protein